MTRAVAGLTIRDRSIRDIGNGLVATAGDARGVRLQRLSIDNVYRVVENKVGSLDDLLVEDVTATQVRRGFARIGGASRGGTFRNVTATGGVTDQPSQLPCGIVFEGTAHDWTIERCVMRGFQMRLADDRYWNGDGFSSELGNYGLRYLRCEAFDNSDGGFDLKSSGTFLDGCVAGGNARNYRFWRTIEAHEITSLTPVARGGVGAPAHVGAYGPAKPGDEPVRVIIGKLIVRSERPVPIFGVHNGPVEIVVAAHDIRTPRGTALVQEANGGKATIIWKSGPPRL